MNYWNLQKKSMEITISIAEIENSKTKLNGMYDEVKELSYKMKKGFEERTVACEVRFNSPHNGKKTVTRTDTGEIVEILNMTAEEMQEDLEFVETEIIDETRQLTIGQNQLKD